jgi:hypothetical protein
MAQFFDIAIALADALGITRSSVQPSTSSIVMNRTPPASSIEKIAEMFG